MAVRPWKIISSNHIHKNVRIDECELADGKTISGFVLDYGFDWVTIVALTAANDVVMIRQYRHGIKQTILELPGGTMDAEDKDAEAAARRELLEETGYTSTQFIEIGTSCPNPANQTNKIHFFLAMQAEKISDQDLDDTEEIEVELKPLEEVIHMAKSGELLQSMQVSAVFFTLAHFNRIN